VSEALQIFDYNKDSISGVEKYGTILAKSGWFGCDKIESGMALVIACQSEQMTITQFLRTFDMVEGKPRKKAIAAYAEFRAKGGRFKWLKTGDEAAAKPDDREARAEVSFENQTVTISFSIADAKLQNLVKPNSNWVKTPGNMLRARVESNAIAMLCPEVYAGCASENDTEKELTLPQSVPTVTVDQIRAGPLTGEERVGRAAPTETKSVVIDVTVQTDEKAEADIGIAPAAEPSRQEPPPPIVPPVAVAAPAGGELPDDTTGKLQELAGEHAMAALKWFVKEGWLKTGEGFHNLTEQRAKMIFANPDRFLRTVTGKKVGELTAEEVARCEKAKS
jgi:hypothetical protein